MPAITLLLIGGSVYNKTNTQTSVLAFCNTICITCSMWVQSLGWEDPLEKGKPTHSSILTWRILWTV